MDNNATEDDNNLENVLPENIRLRIYRYPEAWCLFLYILSQVGLRGTPKKLEVTKMLWNMSKLAVSKTKFMDGVTFRVRIESDVTTPTDETK